MIYGKRTTMAAALAATLFAIHAKAATAATVTYSRGVADPAAANYSLEVELPQFAPTLGTLTGVSIGLEGVLSGYMAYENLGPAIAHGTTFGFNSVVTLNPLFGKAIGLSLFVSRNFGPIAAYDGYADFYGASSIGFTGGQSGRTDVAFANLADFVGSGGFVETLDVMSQDGLYHQPALNFDDVQINEGNFFFNNRTPAIASITYTFDILPPIGGVPEPATWAMLIIGFGLVGVAKRQRQGFTAVSA